MQLSMTPCHRQSKTRRWLFRLPAVALMVVAFPTVGLAAEPLAAQAMAVRYLGVFNAGDRTAYDAFVASHWPGADAGHDEFIGNDDRSRVQSGGYDLVKVEIASQLDAVDVVKARLADEYFRLEVHLRADGEAIDRLTLLPIDRPADVPAPTRLGVAQLGREIDQQLAAMGDFSGAVLVAVDGRKVYQKASGYADRNSLTPNSLETPFRMASMGKMFTAVGVMQLVEAGKLEMDAPIGRYLTDYPNAEFAKTVTIRQLLTHTGGAGDFMSRMWAENYETLRTPSDYVAMFGARAPQFAPGSRYSYANYGYVLLGRLIEVASGQAYANYLQDRIFGPAGMTHSGLDAAISSTPVATTYVMSGETLERSPPPFDGVGSPAGNAFSTVGDMLKFAEALTSSQLLSRQTADEMWTPQVHGDETDFGFGFQIRAAGDVSDVGHDGGGPGQNGTLRIIGRGQAVVVVLTNVAPMWRGDKLGAFIANRVPVH